MRSAVLAVALLSAALVAPSASVAATCSKTAEATTIDLAKLSPVDEGCTVRMEEDGSAVLEIPFYKLPPAPGRRDFLARFDLAGPFDFSECEGLEFDLSCGDISAFTVKQLLMASDGSSGEASGDADWDSYYTFNMKPGEAAATGWRHVTIRKSEAKSYFGHPAGFGTVKRLRFFFMLWHGFPSPVTCRIRNLRMLPPEDMSTDAWVVAGDVSQPERASSGSLEARMIPHYEALKLAGLRSSVVRESDFPQEMPETVRLVVLPRNDFLPERVRLSLESFAAHGGKIVFARNQDETWKRKMLAMGAGEDAAFKLSGMDGARLSGFYDERVAKWFPKLAVTAEGRRKKREADDAARLSAMAADGLGGFRRVFMYCHDARGPTGGAEPWDGAVKFAAENGITDLVVNFSWAATADYKSDVLSVNSGVAKRGDALAECLLACRKYGVRLHAWRCCWRLAGNTPKEILEKLAADGRLQRGSDGNVIRDWLCPNHPENHRMHVEAMVELANKGVDGIHYDFIRYGAPPAHSCFCEWCRRDFERKIGRTVERWPDDVLSDAELLRKWRDFRCDAIGRGVAEIASRVRKELPQVELSSSGGFTWTERPGGRLVGIDAGVGRDWALWARRGWVDFVMLMDYTSERHLFEERVSSRENLDVGKAFLVTVTGPSVWPEEGAAADACRILGHAGVLKAHGLDTIGFFQFTNRAFGYLPLLKQGKTK